MGVQREEGVAVKEGLAQPQPQGPGEVEVGAAVEIGRAHV